MLRPRARCDISARCRGVSPAPRPESAKEDLQQTRTELAAVQAEANRFSLALTGVKQDLEREGRTCRTLEAEVEELRAQLLRAEHEAQLLRAEHEAQRVPEVVSRFLATTAEVRLQQPEITGLAVPVAFTLHVPVQRDGECEYEHYGGVLQEEATKETSMVAGLLGQPQARRIHPFHNGGASTALRQRRSVQTGRWPSSYRKSLC